MLREHGHSGAVGSFILANVRRLGLSRRDRRISLDQGSKPPEKEPLVATERKTSTRDRSALASRMIAHIAPVRAVGLVGRARI